MNSRFRLSTRYGVNTAILIALAVGIAILVEVLSYRHNWKKDFTANRRHSLSEQTLNVVKNLNEKIKVTAFVPKGIPTYTDVKELCDLYAYQSKNLAINLVDPDLNPSLANEFEIRRYGGPVIFFDGSKGRETITQMDEEQITNALIKVTRGEKKAVYYLEGHGEYSLDDIEQNGFSLAKKMLDDKNYKPQSLVLMRAEKVPDDCAVLVIGGPQKDLTEPELNAIDRYIKGGGRVLVLVDPEKAPSLKPLLEKYGIVLGNDYVIDTMSRLLGGDYLSPIITTYSTTHPITKNFNIASLFSLTRSVSTREAPGMKTEWLAKTGDRSWAETDINALKQRKPSFDPNKDTRGPISVAAVSELEAPENTGEKSTQQKHGAIVVFGDSGFITNGRFNLSGNADLFMNAVNWLGGEGTLIAIPPKPGKFSPVVLSAADSKMLSVLTVILLPGLVLIGGVYVFMKRSRHP